MASSRSASPDTSAALPFASETSISLEAAALAAAERRRVNPESLAARLGPEVVAEAVRVLEVISAASQDIELKLESHEFGGCAIDSTGEPLPASTLKACQEADAILMGARDFRKLSCAR